MAEPPNDGDRGTKMTVVGGTIPHGLVDRALDSGDADRSRSSYKYQQQLRLNTLSFSTTLLYHQSVPQRGPSINSWKKSLNVKSHFVSL